MLKATNRKQGEFTYVNISTNLYDIVSLIVELVNWAEELGDALSQQIAWKPAVSQSERPEDFTSLPVLAGTEISPEQL